jgi:predicted RNA-binding Zn ribbon-like protein
MMVTMTVVGVASDPIAEVPLETALAFVNTLEHSRDHDTEHLPTVDSLLAWLAAHGLLDAAAAGRVARVYAAQPATGERALEDARTLRRAVRSLIDARVHDTDLAFRELAVMNRWLGRRAGLRLERTGDRLDLRADDGGDPVRTALGRLAEAAARAIVADDRDRLRVCQNDDCRWTFYDHSRAGRRKWCDMAVCGNRAKARRHREKVAAGQATA